MGNPYATRTVIKNPDDFFGRKLSLINVFDLLSKLTSCSIVGPRRIGKSSLLYHLTHKSTYTHYLSDHEPASYVFAFLDLQEFSGLEPDDFFFCRHQTLVPFQ